MSGLNFTKTRGVFSPPSLLFLLIAISVSIFFPLLFIVLPAVLAHLFLVLFGAKPIENPLLPFWHLAPLYLRSPPF